MQPGDVAVHHGMTIHRADANLSQTRHRRSFAMVFTGVSCRRDEAAFARYSEAAREQHSAHGSQDVSKEPTGMIDLSKCSAASPLVHTVDCGPRNAVVQGRGGGD